ncbi:NADH-quinone oxidoreductase subunit NuoK [Buchnera aphidicola (Periphyllus koelreuteriae)]|uniref:NADH-quinone oxidoreductase subunit NuoK n=1 Tax=Buchnera aphidicola TaxID=9 RepID=UPI0031B85296
MITIFHGLFLSIILFCLGFLCLIIRRNLLYILLGLEIMINSVALLLVFIGNYLHQIDGQIMYIFIITIAASEAGIGLAFLISIYKYKNTLDVDTLREMKK